MNIRILITSILIIALHPIRAEKRIIIGKVYDNTSRDSLPGTIIRNIYTDVLTTTDSLGNFSIEVDDEQLIEFSYLGFNVARVRIHSFLQPKYYSIGLIKTPAPIQIDDRDKTFEEDSSYWANLYAQELGAPKMGVGDWVYRPWEYFSKTNQRKWHLQSTFENYISENYINKYFNEDFIKANSLLTGNELHNFMIFYRPSYAFIRSLTDYEFMLWVKMQAQNYYQKLHSIQIQNQ